MINDVNNNNNDYNHKWIIVYLIRPWTEQGGSSGHTCDLYSGDTWFETWPGQKVS
jgi:hypothetical protein